MRISLKDAAATLEKDPAKLFVKLLEHGTMSVEYYKPAEADFQTPHTQDELYIIASGSGSFIHEHEQYQFQTGDVLFVPAGNVHRFINYTQDFATWVVFYGVKGGEANS